MSIERLFQRRLNPTRRASPHPVPMTQNPDTKYRGRMVGEVIGAHPGDAMLGQIEDDQIENIRTAAVDRHRTGRTSQIRNLGQDAPLAVGHGDANRENV